MGEGRIALDKPSMRFFCCRQRQCALRAKQTKESDDNVNSIWCWGNFVGVKFGFDVALDNINRHCWAPLQFVYIRSWKFHPWILTEGYAQLASADLNYFFPS